MMKQKNSTNKKGRFGEKITEIYALKHNMKILEKNYHSRYGEIDLICEDGDFINFIEVKTRKPDARVSGAEAVGKEKQKKIIKTAYFYIKGKNTEAQPRFDVAEVISNNKAGPARINYIKNAFALEDCYEIF